MTQSLWSAVDAYLTEALRLGDPILDAALAANAAAGLPAHDVSPPQGALLGLLARMVDARRILEIGTLGAYSTIHLARALAPAYDGPDTDGPAPDRIVISLEADPRHAAVARANLARAGLSGTVEVRVGPALDSLAALEAEGAAPFDLVFIDADKANNPAYLAHALRLTRPGGVIIGDNVIREGAVADASSTDPKVKGVRRFFDDLAAAPGVIATAIQTVGSKGHDGFALAIVTGRGPDQSPMRKEAP